MHPEALTERLLDAVSEQPFTPDVRHVAAAARRRHRARAARYAGGGALGLAVALAGGLALLGGAPATSPVAARETRLQPGVTRTVEGDISYRLAEPGAVPALSREAALAAYSEGRTGLSLTSVDLVRFTNDVTGEIQPDGSVVLEFQDVLAWAFIEVGVDPPFYGPIGGTMPPDYPTDCDFVNVVRADRAAPPPGRGFGGMGFFDCGPRD